MVGWFRHEGRGAYLMFSIGAIQDRYAIRTPVGFPTPFGFIEGIGTIVSANVLLGWRVLVIVLVGQSNSGNMAAGYQYVSHRPGRILLLNVFDGQLYYYTEPCIGATGNGGHWIGDAADRLVDAGNYDYVVIVPAAAIGGASVEQFAPGVFGDLRHRIVTCSQRVADLGLRVSCYNYGLGESATGYPEASFRNPLDAMVADVRSQGLDAPWIMDITTYHNDVINTGAVAALTHIVNGTDILAGVNTDDLTYGLGYRLDESGARVHLNQAGCEAKAIRKFNNIAALHDFLPLGVP